MLADAFIHDLDPVLIPISGPIAVRWYGLSYLAGFIIGWLMLRWMAKTNRIAMSVQEVGDFMIYAVVGVIVGGRLGFVLFYDLFRSLADGATPLLWLFTNDFPFWGVLRVTDGGMSMHGGLIGVIIAERLFASRRRLGYLHVMDCAALVTPPGLGLGRVANFINGELWGNRLPDKWQGADSPWWSVKYPTEIHQLAFDNEGRAELLQATDIPRAAGIDPVAWQTRIANYGRPDDAGAEAVSILGRWVEQIIMQVRAGNEALIEVLQPVLTAYYPSQIFQAIAEGLILFPALIIVWLKPRRPGVVSAAFLITYGVLRILTEEFRQPDEGVIAILTMQRGQLLSVGMILLGLGLLVYVFRKKAPRTGGLLRRGADRKPSAASRST